MKKIVVANWKMNGDFELAKDLTSVLKRRVYDLELQLILCPPFLLIPFVEGKLKHNHDIALGAQDVSTHAAGAFTGEISAEMLHAAGCQYVIIGHSERRHYHAETVDMTVKKVEQAVKAGLIPIICIGETLQERENKQVETVLSAQLDPILKKYTQDFMIAYEPIWAIGAGVPASLEEIQKTHAFLRKKLYNCKNVSLLYGGSVNAANARSILSLAEIEGVLVGGASLKDAEMTAICEAAHLAHA